MSPALVQEPHNAKADINYWPPEGTGEELVEGKIKARYLGTGDEYTRRMSILDIRGREAEFTWQECGFQVAIIPKRERNEFDKQWTEEVYYPEVAEVLKRVLVYPYRCALGFCSVRLHVN
jgi:hypothetical protein